MSDLSTAEKIEIIEEAAYDCGDYRDDYSGRGMYGKCCPAITTDDYIDCIEEVASRGVRGARIDNMGRSYVVYWPGIRIEPKGDDDE